MLSRRDILMVVGALAAGSCARATRAADVAPPAGEQLATVTLAITGMT